MENRGGIKPSLTKPFKNNKLDYLSSESLFWLTRIIALAVYIFIYYTLMFCCPFIVCNV